MKIFGWIVLGLAAVAGALFIAAKKGAIKIPLISSNSSLPSGGAAQAAPVSTAWNPFTSSTPAAPIVPGATSATKAAQASNQSGDLLSSLLTPANLGSAVTAIGNLFAGGNSSMTPSSTYSTGGAIDTPALYLPDDSSSYNDYFDNTTLDGPLYSSSLGDYSLV